MCHAMRHTPAVPTPTLGPRPTAAQPLGTAPPPARRGRGPGAARWLGGLLFGLAGGLLGSSCAQAGVLVRAVGAEVEVEFVFHDERAGSVSVAGSFNQWSPSASPMTRQGDRWHWVLRGAKASDVLQYKFVRGTSQQWLLDPEAPDTTPDGQGGRNGLVVVRQFLASANPQAIPADLGPRGAAPSGPLSLNAQPVPQGSDAPRNLLADPGFERGTLDGWTLRGDSETVLIERNPGNLHGGSAALKYADGLNQAFNLLLLKRLSGLAPGRYSFKAWTMGGGGEPSVQLFARDCGGPVRSAAVVNTGWQKWRQVSVQGIPVGASGECTIGLHVQGLAGQWGVLDDLSFEPDASWSRLTVESGP